MKTKLTIIMLLVSVASFAQTFIVDGLDYSVTSTNPNEVQLSGGTPLENLVIPESVTFNSLDFQVTEIANNTFQNENFSSVTLPSTITNVGGGAFRFSQIQEVIFLGANPPTRGGNVLTARSNMNLFVPEGSQDAYRNGSWSGFFSINNVPEIGITFSVNDLDYSIVNNNPLNVAITGGTPVENLTIPESVTFESLDFQVTEIANNTFQNENFNSITLPSTITNVGGEAFRFSQIQEVIFLGVNPPTRGGNVLTARSNMNLFVPEGSQNAYRNGSWSGFFSINNVPEIGVTFSVSNLTYSVIGNDPLNVSLTGGTPLENLTITESVTFNSLDFQVTEIANNTFQNENFSSVTIPITITNVGGGAFRFSQIQEVIFLGVNPPSSGINVLTQRGSTNLFVPEGSQDAYRNGSWNGFFSINNAREIFTVNNLNYEVTSRGPNEVQITGGTTIPTNLVLPETVSFENEDFTLIKVADDIFQNDNFSSVTIPNTITNVGGGAFRFSQIQEVVFLGVNPPTRESNAFLQRSNTNLFVPEGSEDAYRDGSWNGFFSINSVPEIGADFSVNGLDFSVINNNPLNVAVTGGTPLETLTIPESVTFNSLDFQVTEIDNNTFQNENFNSITLPSTITNVGGGAFRFSQIQEVIFLGVNPPTRGANVIPQRSNTNLFVPEGSEDAYREGSWNGFFSINNVPEIGITFSVNDLDYSIVNNNPLNVAITGGTPLENLTIPESVTFESLDFQVTEIANNTFQNENFNSVTLPSTITNVGGNAFRFSQIQEVVFLAVNPPTRGGNALAQRSDTDIFVPEGTTQSYLIGVWSGFKSVTEIESNVTLQLKAFLQGAYINPNTAEEDLMRDDLRESGLFPSNSPYEDARPINDSIAFFSAGENAMVDWILVELIDADDSTTVLDSRSLIVLRNGEIKDHHTVDLEIFDPVFDTPTVQNYFIRIQHRNHVAIQTITPISSQLQTVNLDFTSDPTLVEGGQNALVEVSKNIFAMIAGDFDENGQVQPSDVNETTAAIGTSSYSNADMDMNGQIQPADVNNLVNPNVGRGVQFTTAE